MKKSVNRQSGHIRYNHPKRIIKEAEERVSEQIEDFIKNAEPRMLNEGEAAFFVINEIKIPCIINKAKYIAGLLYYDLFIPIHDTRIAGKPTSIGIESVNSRFILPQE